MKILFILQAITDLIGFFDFSKETNAILVHAQHSVLCYLESLKYTQLCNNNFSPIVGNITNHVDRVRIIILIKFMSYSITFVIFVSKFLLFFCDFR